ncbi:protein containing cAMP-binding domain of CRP [Bacteroidales bacterium 6E]|nr:protein containing cAMP-binding domain of CRP [Bacteroidales bacterium 6E]
MDTKSWLIANSPDCFTELYPEELKLIDEKRTQLVYQKGENLLKQGAFATHVIYVIDGLVKLYLQTGFNKQINIRLARRGDFLAFPTLFGETVYGYSAVAVKNSTVSMIDKEALQNLLRENTNFAMRITAKNFRHEAYLLEIIKNLSYKQMRGKLASALLYLSQPDFLEEEVFQHLTRQDIGDFASISAESTIKFLKEFEKEGILSLSGKEVIINDLRMLTEISLKG